MGSATRTNVGVLGIGTFLPEQIRRNDWWQPSVVAGWRDRSHNLPTMARLTDGSDSRSPGAARVIAALVDGRSDPFQGALERRVAPDDLPASEMEARAAREAIERAGIGAGEIDFVLSYSACPDYLGVPNACALHRALELPRACLSLATEAAANTFLLQLEIAQQLIAGGRFRHGLLVQSSNMTRLLPPEQPASALFGDGASAVVVGPVAEGRGVLGSAHRTDGANFSALVIGVPGGRWNDAGRAMLYAEDAQRAARVILAVPDRGKEVTDEALARAGTPAAAIDFFACHQCVVSMRQVTQEVIGLGHARTVDTFPWAGNLSAANIPLVLSVAEREGSLRDGDRVVAFSGGFGDTWSSVVLRWGRA